MVKHPYCGTLQIYLVHQLPGRVRLSIPALRGNPAMADFLKRIVVQEEGVHQIQANPLTGRVLLLFEESQIKLSQIIGVLKEKLTPSMNKLEESLETEPLEPEDLPIKKQLINVALGGGVLAYLGLKHYFIGRTPLAKHPHLFNLAAATTIVSGYPVLRSGVQGLAKGRINHDLIMTALALGTTLARESIPGLMVMWLTNLAALGQSLVLRKYLRSLPPMPGAGQELERPEDGKVVKWSEEGQQYGRKMILPVLGLSTLQGLIGGAGGFQKTLAMLLAANPSPAGLAAPTAVAASISRAGRKGILYRNARTVEKLSTIDTVIFNGTGSLPKISYQVGEVLPMPGISKKMLLNLAAKGAIETEHPLTAELSKAYKRQRGPSSELTADAQLILGDEQILQDAGIDVQWGVFKARRLQHLQQVPLYVARNGKLAGLIGIKQGKAADIQRIIQELRTIGISRMGLLLDKENAVVGQIAEEWGIGQVWACSTVSDKTSIINNIKQQGHQVAVVLEKADEVELVQSAAVVICPAEGVQEHPVDVVIEDFSLLSETFRIPLQSKQKAKQNLALVQAANALGLALASTGKLPPMAAKVFGDLISVAVCTNSFRLLSRGKASTRRLLPTAPAKLEIAAALEEAMNPTNTFAMESHYQCSGWHSMSMAETLRRLSSDLNQGLSAAEVRQRLEYFGRNQMAEAPSQSFFSRLWGQFKDFLVKTLMVSALVCGIMGQFGDALAIVAILVTNAILGALQEQKAEGALQALSKMTAPTAKVRREGQIIRIPASELVPGDIVLLEQGDGVPADLRLLEATGLEIEESALTGESYPVAKNASQMADCVPLLDCENLAFTGTNVTRGKTVGVVIATGMSTEIGKIAGLLNKQERGPTPLQNRMADVGAVILKYCLAVSGLVVLAGILRGGSLFKMFLTGVSLAVAAIPEGLPAVVTIALASGVRRMAKENAVVRHLPAVETLGSATLICTDKTGTITQNRQQVVTAFSGSGWWQAENAGKPLLPTATDNKESDELTALLTAGILCNNAELRWLSQKKGIGKPLWKVEGDPTEGALLLAGIQGDLNYKELREKWLRIREIPFDAERLRMAVVCQQDDAGTVAFIKGAPEVVVSLCSQVKKGDQILPLGEEFRQEILKANEQMTGEAKRVLAIAYRPLEDSELTDPEQNLVFLGLVGMVDPPRPGVSEAIATCHRAGIKVAMITGDHPHTALAIAKQVGICQNNLVLTGRNIDGFSDLELAAAVRDVRVFARVLPAQKLRLVQAFHNQGEILAMVGDGINDAPAVKEADIGVAMGQTGTDVTKQAADIILTDDNFVTLVSAIEQGRGIYNNIRRSVRYLLATNVGLVLLVFLAVTFGLPMPLLPIQLLFVNLLGDGLPALALGVEPTTGTVMHQPPRPASESFFADGLGTQILSRGLATGLVGLETYRRVVAQGDTLRASTVAMASFIASKLLFALECGEKKGAQKNRYLTGSVALSALLLAGAVYLPLGRRIFRTSSLGLGDISTVIGAASLTFVLEKIFTGLMQNHRRNLVCPG